MSRLSANQGFTLMELMIAIAVLGALLALGWPSFTEALSNNRLAAASNSMIAGVNLARSEAMRSNRAGGVCPSADGATCAADWSAGWLVWNDANADGAKAADEPAIRYFQGNPAQVALASAGAAVPSIVFDRRGRMTAPAANAVLTAHTVDCTTGAANKQRRLTITRAGQVRIQKESCS